MSDNKINIDDSRYSRLELIPWWEQDILRNAKILVVGCGALGNEIVKNLVMLGIGNIFVVDMDKVEKSNLSRSVFFRKEDEGKFKAETVAKRAKEINDDISVKYFNGSVFELGLGIFKKMDLVLCGLDNREARLFVNQSCWKVSKPWIDGGIEALSGVARMFSPPDGVCYECTMTENDYKILNKRKSCMLLGIDEIASGKIPTTPTISSIIAGLQVQEAVKYLHKKNEHLLLNGKGFVFNGNTNDSYIVEYQKKEDCLSHWTFENIVRIDKKFEETRVMDLFENKKSVLQFNNEIVCALQDESGKEFEFFGNMNLLNAKDITINGNLMKPVSFHNIGYSSDLYERIKECKLRELGVPWNDILSMGEREVEFVGEEVFSC